MRAARDVAFNAGCPGEAKSVSEFATESDDLGFLALVFRGECNGLRWGLL